MGDRGQIRIVDSGVYLYTHWGATDLPDVLRTALSRRERWNDPEYLTRIIFSEMIRDEIDGETGYGIGKTQHGDVYRVLDVNVDKQTVKTIGYDNDHEVVRTFEQFVNC